jgi:hypothetical protein
VKEWTLTLPSEPPLSELKSRWTPKFSGKDCKGQNSLNWNVIETWMSKVGQHHPFGHLKHKLWPKERSEVKLTIWLSTTKSQESTNFLMCMWHVTYHWKAFDEGYNFALDLISIRGFHTKLWGPKIAGVPTLGISGFGSPKTKCHLNVGLVERHRVYYKGEGGGFPQVWVQVCLWFVLVPKVFLN